MQEIILSLIQHSWPLVVLLCVFVLREELGTLLKWLRGFKAGSVEVISLLSVTLMLVLGCTPHSSDLTEHSVNPHNSRQAEQPIETGPEHREATRRKMIDDKFARTPKRTAEELEYALYIYRDEFQPRIQAAFKNYPYIKGQIDVTVRIAASGHIIGCQIHDAELHKKNSLWKAFCGPVFEVYFGQKQDSNLPYVRTLNFSRK